MTSSLHHAPRLYCPVALRSGASIALSDEQHHYLRHVMGRDNDSPLRIFNPHDGEWHATLVYPDKRHAAAIPSTLLHPAALTHIERHLFFSPLKKDRLDMLIEKSVELGVTHLHPILFQRSVVRVIKEDRIKAQVIEAVEQCERLDIPSLSPLMDIKQALNEWRDDTPLFAAIERHTAQLLAPFEMSCGFLVGPEGGITSDEQEMLLSCPFMRPVSLGSRILRAETAVFYGLSIMSSTTP